MLTCNSNYHTGDFLARNGFCFLRSRLYRLNGLGYVIYDTPVYALTFRFSDTNYLEFSILVFGAQHGHYFGGSNI